MQRKSVGRAAIPVLLLALAACSAGGEVAPPAPPPPVVTVAAPLAREIVDWDDYVGRFEAVERVEVRPRVSGVLTRIHFRDGAIVRRGQLLFTIDPRPFTAQLAQARAEQARATTELALARSELARSRSLLALQAVSREEFDTRNAAVRSEEADVEAAAATARSRALDVEFTQIRAPITGRVSDRRIDVGNLVSGGDLTSASLLTTITSLDPIHFTFDGSEALYLKYLRQNQAGTRASSRYASNPVEIQLQDEPDYRWRGRMDFVDNSLDDGAGTIRGRAVVRNPDYFLTPGMFGRARLLGSGAYTALLIPDSSVQTDQARKFALVVTDDGTVERRIVELGPLISGLRIVRNGLKADERVIVQGAQMAMPGAKVNTKRGRIEPPAPGRIPGSGRVIAPPASEATVAGSVR